MKPIFLFSQNFDGPRAGFSQVRSYVAKNSIEQRQPTQNVSGLMLSLSESIQAACHQSTKPDHPCLQDADHESILKHEMTVSSCRDHFPYPFRVDTEWQPEYTPPITASSDRASQHVISLESDPGKI